MNKIIKVIVSPPVTTIIWLSDGGVVDSYEYTTVKLGHNDAFDEEKGILWAIAKKFMSGSDILAAIKEGKESLRKTK